MKTIMFAFDYQVNKALKTYELLLKIWSGRIKAVELAEFCKVVKLSLEGSVTNRATMSTFLHWQNYPFFLSVFKFGLQIGNIFGGFLLKFIIIVYSH